MFVIVALICSVTRVPWLMLNDAVSLRGRHQCVSLWIKKNVPIGPPILAEIHINCSRPLIPLLCAASVHEGQAPGVGVEPTRRVPSKGF